MDGTEPGSINYDQNPSLKVLSRDRKVHLMEQCINSIVLDVQSCSFSGA